MKINWIQFFIVGILAVLVGIFFSYSFIQKGPTNESTSTEIDAKISAAVASAIQEKDAEIASLKEQLSQQNETTEETTTVVIKNIGGYLLDDLYLESPINKIFSDRELNLFDGKVEFDGKNYNAEETFSIINISLKANEKDFDGNPYLIIPRKSIEYKMIFESTLPFDEIGEDQETLKFDFLGEEVEVSKWDKDANEITFSHGDKYLLNQGDEITVLEKKVKLSYVAEEKVIVDVDGISASIKEGSTRLINGLQIKAYDVLYSSSQLGKAYLIIGEEVEKTVEDGDKYEDSSIWLWKIEENSIGLILDEEFEKLDEEYNALAKNEELCLPDNYTCIIYNGLIDSKNQEYTFDFDSYEGYIQVDGEFIKELEDYDRVYIKMDGTGIYEKDGDFVLIDSSNIELADTDSILELTDDGTDGFITFNDFRIMYDLDEGTLKSIEVGDSWTNISSKDEDYKTNYGIFIFNPEEGIENEEITIIVPEEKVTGSINVIDKKSKQALNKTSE